MTTSEAVEAPTPQQPEPPTPDTPVKAGAGRIILGFVFSILSAVMLFVMWNSHGNIWPFVFIGFIPMYIAAYRLFPRKLAPFAFAFAGFGYWLAMALDGGGVLPPAVVIGIALGMAIVWFVLGIWERRFSERTRYKWFIVQLPLLWIGLEVIFENNPIMGSNFWIAYRTAVAPQIAQPVSVVSTPAYGFVIIMFNAILALWIMKLMDRKWPQLTAVAIPAKTIEWSSIIAFGVIIVWIAASFAILAKVNSELGKSVTVAAAQSGIQNTTSSGLLGEGGEQGTPADNARNAKLQAQLTQMTMDAAKQGAQLVVWPEEELDYDVRVGNKGAWVGELAKAANTTIVSGFMPQSPDLTSPNLAAVWYPNGMMAPQIYSKVHQVVVEGEAFTSGTVTPSYPTNFGQLGVIICFDHDFPDGSPRLSALAGNNILAVPAIDPYTISHLRWQSVVFRSIENRIPLVKTDVGFDSVIVNANGSVVKRVATDTPEGSTNLLVGNVNIGPRNAPFTQTGGYTFAWLVILGLFARYIRQIYLWRRSKKEMQS